MPPGRITHSHRSVGSASRNTDHLSGGRAANIIRSGCLGWGANDSSSETAKLNGPPPEGPADRSARVIARNKKNSAEEDRLTSAVADTQQLTRVFGGTQSQRSGRRKCQVLFNLTNLYPTLGLGLFSGCCRGCERGMRRLLAPLRLSTSSTHI